MARSDETVEDTCISNTDCGSSATRALQITIAVSLSCVQQHLTSTNCDRQQEAIVSTESHPSFPEPDNKNAAIWRYMSFSKFVAMMTTRSLWFSHISQLEDKYEGRRPRKNYTLAREWADGLREKLPHIKPDDLYEMFTSRSSRLMEVASFVNCWHVADHESFALWRIYARDGEGVAVKSNFALLKAQMPAQVLAGLVRYIDYWNDAIPGGNDLSLLTHKRRELSYERELRAVLWDPETLADRSTDPPTLDMQRPVPKGLPIGVDLKALMSSIYVAPTAPSWFRDLVQQQANAAGLSLDVQHSQLDRDPGELEPRDQGVKR